eukprot:5704402-Lingulodinium_polyedra.AAC.1
MARAQGAVPRRGASLAGRQSAARAARHRDAVPRPRHHPHGRQLGAGDVVAHGVQGEGARVWRCAAAVLRRRAGHLR